MYSGGSSLKMASVSMGLHSVTSHKTVLYIFTVMGISNDKFIHLFVNYTVIHSDDITLNARMMTNNDLKMI
jgi:hypothetical protein